MGNPGRPTTEIEDEVIGLLKDMDKPAMTVGEITDRVGASRATVNKRLIELSNENIIEAGKIGNATAYWVDDNDSNDYTEQIQELIEHYERPFMGTGEFAEELGFSSNPGVKKHLEKAVSKDVLEHTQISGYNIWFDPKIVEDD